MLHRNTAMRNEQKIVLKLNSFFSWPGVLKSAVQHKLATKNKHAFGTYHDHPKFL